MQCKHFYVTREASFPRGCRLFAIKSRQLPMIEILRIDGHACRGYTPKSAAKVTKK
ncbi:MAG TPA: uracil-DNA glycosylase [Oceanospirillaceae bacterium]|nr:uracil-DNA glycosylase [Oceanospirillaceae bacterium]